MRLSGRLSIALLAAFWVLIFGAGWLHDGYQHYRFHVSVLAADGMPYSWVAVIAICCTAFAHLVVVPLTYRWRPLVGACLFICGIALLLVAAFPITCPNRVRFCTFTGAESPSNTVHAAGVGLYAAAMVAAMLYAGVTAVLGHQRSLVGVPGLIAAAVFVIAFSGLLTAPVGLAQRVWIAVGQLWLVGAIVEAAEHADRADRGEHHARYRA